MWLNSSLRSVVVEIGWIIGINSVTCVDPLLVLLGLRTEYNESSR